MNPWEIVETNRAAWESGNLRDDDGVTHRDGGMGEDDFAQCGWVVGAFPTTDAIDCPDCLALSGRHGAS